MSHKFSKNSKYYTIGAYAVGVFAVCVIILKIIWCFDDTVSFFSSVLGVVTPFLVGMLIAYLINPLATAINKRIFRKIFKKKAHKTRKAISILLSYFIIIGIIVTMLFYIIPQIADTLVQITGLINTAQTGYNAVIDTITDVSRKYPEWKLDAVIKFIKDMPDFLTGVITDALPKILPTIYTTSVSVISGVIDSIIALIVSVYMLLDKSKLLNNARRLVYAVMKPQKADSFLKTASECNKIFGNFIIGKMIDSIIIGFLCWLFMLILKLPYGLVISVIVGVTNMIPYFGPFIGAIPGALLLIIVDFKYAVIFAVLIFVLQQFDGLYLGPKILGESTGLRPIWIIFAITVGGWAAGVLGMFLGVPVVAVIAYLLDRHIGRKLKERDIKFGKDEETGLIYRRKAGEEEDDYPVDDIVDDTEKDGL